MKRILAPVMLFLLIACAQPTTMPSSEVYRLQGYYAAARIVENTYYDLPRCGKPTSPKLCSNIDVLTKVRKADDIAYAALVEADKAVNDPGFGDSKVKTTIATAEALINTFVSLTNTLKVK